MTQNSTLLISISAFLLVRIIIQCISVTLGLVIKVNQSVHIGTFITFLLTKTLKDISLAITKFAIPLLIYVMSHNVCLHTALQGGGPLTERNE